MKAFCLNCNEIFIVNKRKHQPSFCNCKKGFVDWDEYYYRHNGMIELILEDKDEIKWHSKIIERNF